MNPCQEKKVYVAVGNEIQDGFKTLEWTLQKWKSHPISITILHISYNITRDFVYTPSEFCLHNLDLNHKKVYNLYSWVFNFACSWEATCNFGE